MKRIEPKAAVPDVATSAFSDGVRALLDAEQLGKSEAGLTSALLLGRAALRHLVRATLLDRDQLEQSSAEAELWRSARLLPVLLGSSEEGGWIAGADAWFERFVVSPTGDLELAEVPSSEQAVLLGEMVSLGLRLAAPLDEARNGAERRARRRKKRIGIGAGVGLLLLVWMGWRIWGPENLALGKPVVADDATLGIDPKGLVDGDQLNMGFHSSRRRDPNVTIDLGAVHAITRLEIFNRPDCCQERAVPMAVRTSIDGVHFTTVRREEHTFFHLTVRLKQPTPARFVRLVRLGVENFHLTEVEVY